QELDAGNVQQAITCLLLNSMSAKWYTDVIPQRAALHCIPNGRTPFIRPSGETPPTPRNGFVLSYFGPQPERFEEVFRRHGQILTPERKEDMVAVDDAIQTLKRRPPAKTADQWQMQIAIETLEEFIANIPEDRRDASLSV